MATKGSTNPFEEDDFTKSSYQKYGWKGDIGTGQNNYDNEWDRPQRSRLEELQEQKQNSMNRQLESTQRCIASIYDSEQMGIATADELVRQGEQLDNVERKVDKINADTRVSQRHLNSIKSIFGGLKNWWNGENTKEDNPAPAQPKDRSNPRLESALNQPRDTGVHPALRLRNDNYSGFYQDNSLDNDFLSSGRSGSSNVVAARSQVANSSARATSSTARSTEFQEYDDRLNESLETMSMGMSRLKNLAVGLGDEIETQNEQIDRIAPKVDRADIKIRDQNRQMRQILGK